MTSIGYQPFGLSAEQLAKLYRQRFGKTALAFLKQDPEMSDMEVARALLAWFTPERLVFEDPTHTLLTWSTKTFLTRHHDRIERYTHEASVPFKGTRDLWRLCGSIGHRFETRVSATFRVARFRMLSPTRDTEAFRTIVAREMDQAHEVADSQDGSIQWLATLVHAAVDHVFGHDDLGGLRDLAREHVERRKRLGIR